MHALTRAHAPTPALPQGGRPGRLRPPRVGARGAARGGRRRGARRPRRERAQRRAARGGLPAHGGGRGHREVRQRVVCVRVWLGCVRARACVLACACVFVSVCVCVCLCVRVHARALTSPSTPCAPAHRTHPPTHACKHCSFTGAASPPSSPSPPPPAFAVATAHDAACDAEWASRGAVAASTLVLFMGARRLGAVAAALREGEWEEATPLAVVQWAHTTRQRVFVSTVGRCACVCARVRTYACVCVRACVRAPPAHILAPRSRTRTRTHASSHLRRQSQVCRGRA